MMSYSRESSEEREKNQAKALALQALSDVIYVDLRASNHADNYDDHLTKDEGLMPGVILIGKNKGEIKKTVYAKLYADHDVDGEELNKYIFNELNDWAAFKMLKELGGRGPKVKLRVTPKTRELLEDNADNDNRYNFYLFSTDICHPRRKQQNENGKKYWFATFDDLYKKEVSVCVNGKISSLTAKKELLPAADANAPRKIAYSYPIDRDNAARTLLLIQILQLQDLHGGNGGFVLSRNAKGEVKAKLALIDFCIWGNGKIEHALTLKDLILSSFGKASCHKNILKLATSITPQEYLAAINKIEENFLKSCEDRIAEVEAMPEVSLQRKQEFKVRMATVRENFEIVKGLVHRNVPAVVHAPVLGTMFQSGMMMPVEPVAAPVEAPREENQNVRRRAGKKGCTIL